ncbi:MAG: putative toxin-antitoxin system toxin component, PIN family [Cytophagaceae bacterium]|nr:putative toxin-antitoxin system toxin component, PIN family [Cytophagaceae bacterium]
MRIVVDTNDFISALIGKKHREKLRLVLNNPDIEVFADVNLLAELSEVAYRDKFRKQVTLNEIALFLEVVEARLTKIIPTTIVTDSPDPDNNYLLSIAIDSQAEYFIADDKKHLLALSPYRGIQIIRLHTFLEISSCR